MIKGLYLMNYFRYGLGDDFGLSSKIWLELQNWRYYAIKLYGFTNAEDAMYATYDHVLKHYNENFGELKTYIVSTLSKIYISKNKKETSTEDNILEVELNSATEPSKEYYDIIENSLDESVEHCKELMTPMYIQDFTFLNSLRQSDRKFDYTVLSDLFKRETISKTILMLKNKYDDVLSRLYNNKVFACKGYDLCNYSAFYDTQLDFVCVLNDIVVCKKKKSNKCKRKVYILDLRKLVSNVKNLYKDMLSCVVEDYEVWCTFSGTILYDEYETNNKLENEVLGKLLSMLTSLKILAYEKGVIAYLTLPSHLEDVLSVELLGRRIIYDLEEIPMKVV